MRTITLMFSVVALLGACRGATPPAAAPSDPHPLGATPSGSPSAAPTGGSAPAPTDPATPTTTASPDPEPRAFITVGSLDDTRGDAGTEARAYNDLVGVRVQDDGEHARFLVRLGASIPNPMRDGEQMSIGIDLFRRSSSEESDFQIFAAGTEEGWLAFLETPNGFADYDGIGARFTIVDDIMGFTVPWSALGEMRDARYSVFLDWDRDAIAIALAGRDAAPNSGRASFSR